MWIVLAACALVVVLVAWCLAGAAHRSAPAPSELWQEASWPTEVLERWRDEVAAEDREALTGERARLHLALATADDELGGLRHELALEQQLTVDLEEEVARLRARLAADGGDIVRLRRGLRREEAKVIVLGRHLGLDTPMAIAAHLEHLLTVPHPGATKPARPVAAAAIEAAS